MAAEDEPPATDLLGALQASVEAARARALPPRPTAANVHAAVEWAEVGGRPGARTLVRELLHLRARVAELEAEREAVGVEWGVQRGHRIVPLSDGQAHYALDQDLSVTIMRREVGPWLEAK